MKTRNFLWVSLVAVTLSSPVMADNHFTGFYLGANAGYASGKMKYENTEDGHTELSGPFGMDGFAGGLHVGYLYQMGSLVFGGEGGFNMSAVEAKVQHGDWRYKTTRDNAFVLSGRLGGLVNSWLLYGKLGWENAKFKLQSTGNNNAGDDYVTSKRFNGFLVGLGMETALTQNILLGGEWNYTMFELLKCSGTGDTQLDTWRPRINDFKVRLSYKF